jgi:hypothetical protein
MGFIAGFVGVFVILGGVFLAFANLGAGVSLVSIGLALVTFASVKTPPGWAFERAHRGSKAVWLLIAIIGLIPPFGLVYLALWMIFGRAVEREWATGDPESYKNYKARIAAARRR